MTKPSHAVPPSSLRVTPAGASTARPSHAPAPPYHPAAQTRRSVAHRTPGQPAAGPPRRRTRRRRRLCLFLCPSLTTSAPERPSPQSRPGLFMVKDKPAPDSSRPTTSASANPHTEPLRATKKPIRHYPPPDAVPQRAQPPASAEEALNADRSSRTTTTSPGDIAGRCIALVFVSVTASVPPATVAAPRRTRRCPPRVLFLECAGSCSCACPFRAPASSPTSDAGQGPAPRPGTSVATGLRRMSARPPDHSGQPPRAGEIAKEQCSSFAKTQPAPHPASALILAWTLPRSCAPTVLQPAPVLRTLQPAARLAASTSMTLQDQQDAGTTMTKPPHAVPPSSLRVTPAGASTARPSHAPAPPYHPADKTRRHVTHRTPGRPAADTPGRRQIARPNTGRPCASPSPSLRSTLASAWAAQAHRLPRPAVCANVNTCRRRRASRYSAHRRRHRRETTTRHYMPPDCHCL